MQEQVYQYEKWYSEIAGATEKDYGTEAQWNWLSSKMQDKHSFSGVIYDEFGTSSNLEHVIQEIDVQKEPNKHWLYWLAMKSYGTTNSYLQKVLENSKNESDFEEHIYLDLADEELVNQNFEKMYIERRKLLERVPEQLPLIARYCEKLGKHEKDLPIPS